MVPLFLAALLAVRGVPAMIYGLDRRETLVAGLLQATSLSFSSPPRRSGRSSA